MTETPKSLRHLLEDPVVIEVLTGRRPWILALDYDGTLAPFSVERDHATPYAGMRDVLNRLPTSGQSRFVMISGREAADISRLLNIQPEPEIWGCHGAQRVVPGHAPVQADLSPAQKEAMQQVGSLVEDGSLVEVKSFSVAIHWRGLSRERGERLKAEVAPELKRLAEDAGLEVHAFNGGIELRLPGVDKGAAIRTLLLENPEVAVFHLGDDATDEDAFAALDGRGYGVLVSDNPRPTNAAYWIRPPQELLTLLGRFAITNPHKRSLIRV